VQANAAQSWVVPALVIGGIATTLLVLSSSSKAGSATPPLNVPPQIGPAAKCVVSQNGLAKWAMTVNMTAIHVPMLGITDPVSAPLAIDILPSEIMSKLNALPGNEQIVLVDKNDVFHYFASKTAPTSTRRDDLYADYCNKVGGKLSGHPTDLFMVW